MAETQSSPLQQAEQILASAQYQQKVKDVKSAVASCVEAIGQVCGLDENGRKTLAYVALSTHIPPERKPVNPPLTVIGDTGTGKTSAMRVVMDYCNEPGEVHAKNLSYAITRNRIVQEIENEAQTIVVEEADRCLQATQLEEFIFSCYSRDTCKGEWNVPTATGHAQIWKQHGYNLFLPFFVHRRSPYSDVANANRGIEVLFEPAKGKFADPDDVDRPNTEKMCPVADLFLVEPDRPEGIEGRVWKNWRTLVSIANALGDTEWSSWVTERLKKDTQTMQDGRGFEPRQVIFLSTVASSRRVVETKDDGTETVTYKPCPLSRIKETASREYGMDLSHRQIKAVLRELGVTIKFPRGINNAVLTDDIIKQIATKLDLDEKELLGNA